MLTIGEFSKLSRVSPRMLRHYDLLGLLQPAQTGADNGYRYYEAEQLDVLRSIETLKDYGFSLAEIRDLLPLGREALAERIHARRLQAYEELHQLRSTLRRMEDAIIEMEGNALALNQYHVIVLQNPEQRVLAIRRTINISETHDLFRDLHQKARELGLKRTGVTQMVYLGEEFNHDSMDVEAQVEVSGHHPDIKVIPACTCAATTHTGPYERLRYAYEALTAWMAEHPEYRVCGPGIERYIRDEDMAAGGDELETGILLPVTKIK